MVDQQRLDQLQVHEQAAFEQAGIDWLQPLRALLQRAGIRFTCLPEGRGTARLFNLLRWDLEQQHEYIDGTGIMADQLVHLGVHHAVARRLPAGRDGALLGETLASAVDLLMLGKLSNAGLETDFLIETLESFASYYELYAETENQLERLLAQVVEQPYAAFLELSDFLFDFCEPLLSPTSDQAMLAGVKSRLRHLFYPLAHHYNLSNWVLILRSKYPNDEDDASSEPAQRLREQLQQGEHAFKQMLLSP